MQWSDLWAALALMLILEGLMPFLSPAGFRKKLLEAAKLEDKVLRTLGLISMLIGLMLLNWAR